MSKEQLKIINPVEDPSNPPTIPHKRCAHPKNQIRLQEESCAYEICPLTYEQLLNIMGGDCRYERKSLNVKEEIKK